MQRLKDSLRTFARDLLLKIDIKSKMFMSFLQIAAAGILLIFSDPVLAQIDGASFFRTDANVPWNISADEVEYDQKTNQYSAKGNVTIIKQDRKLTADLVRFDHSTMKAVAEGHVVMTAGEDVLNGDRIEIDLKTETGMIYDANIFLKENHFYIKGNKIQKTDKNTYTAETASITACGGDSPAWKLTGRNLRVTIEGYGFVKHATFWAKDIPLVYIPFFMFPVKQKRQTGLLLPQMGYSDRKGAEYDQPLFWVINDQSDATLYFHHIGKRGNKIGLEYRYVSDAASKGAMMLDFFNDDKKDDGSPEATRNWGYDEDSVTRPNTDRYWFRMKHNFTLPADFFATLDIDRVSDQDYLHEFRDGYSGFSDTKAYFNEAFGREIEDYNDPVRVNRLNVKKNWADTYSLNAGAWYYDDVISRRWEETDSTLHKLPFISLDSVKQQISGTPFLWQLDSEYTYFYREDGSKGHRTDIHPQVALPGKIKNYLFAEAALGFRETLWYSDKDEHALREKDRADSRGLYDIKLDVSSNLFRMFDLKNKARMKHTVIPQIIYEYIPDSDQDDNPFFDPEDRIEKKNLITCSLTHIFMGRLGEPAQTATDASKAALAETDKPALLDAAAVLPYWQFCRFKVEQGYDINEANESDSSEWKNQEGKQPFLPIYAELGLYPNDFLAMQADAQWSHHDSRLESCNASLSIENARKERLFVQYRYSKDWLESVYADLRLRLSDRFSVYSDYERNLHDGKEIRSSVGIVYDGKCWSADFRHANEEGDRKFAFRVNLYGLGSTTPP